MGKVSFRWGTERRKTIKTTVTPLQLTATAIQGDTRWFWAASIFYKREEVWSMSCDWLGVYRR